MSSSSEYAIEVANLTKRFGDKVVVDQLSMQVRKGEIYGFLGPNGSGKTTSIRMMCGLLTPDGGTGQTLGLDILSQAADIKREVGYMTQRFGLYSDLSIRENLDFVARVYAMDQRKQRVNTALERLGLVARQQQLAGSLSGGWKQRLALAAALLHQPQLLLLDEPTAGVDPQARRDFWEQIHQLATEGITILVSTHYMDEAERCHRLSYIAYGRLLATGTPQELIEQSGLQTWTVSGAALSELSKQLLALSAVDMHTQFGNALHISGKDPQALAQALQPFQIAYPHYQWSEGQPTLEDVFIYLMQQATDNFQTAGKT
ncbi:ABC transporter ATP-binding protein [uncultured Thiothrix sp.]|uniref:ABC transporter ATP-binding protein n=1 Tax=uncultured Thiothrix sp. TaxID=223185 RepID=UPI002612E3F2|nr:ABC transporter ATP-binding protein [uncultured Thiothrix sp.]HMT92547.1 ABC transporter ATP-binding protein [Thiolinea sp.]